MLWPWLLGLLVPGVRAAYFFVEAVTLMCRGSLREVIFFAVFQEGSERCFQQEVRGSEAVQFCAPD